MGEKNGIETELALLRQSIEGQVVPLLKKHDDCLYGEKGDDGIVRDINYIRGLVYLVVTLVGGGAVAGGLHFVFKVF